jgi:hypothetical protein
VLFILSYRDQIKNYVMGRACTYSMNGRGAECLHNLGGNVESKKTAWKGQAWVGE